MRYSATSVAYFALKKSVIVWLMDCTSTEKYIKIRKECLVKKFTSKSIYDRPKEVYWSYDFE